jgi:predicted TIM-barrel fold metal-dependent hydrolase
MKIDIFNHLFPRNYFDRMVEQVPQFANMAKRVSEVPALVDLGARFRVMDQFENYVQILSLPGSPPLEVLVGPERTPELTKIANDGMAELVDKHRDRFPGFIASLPMNNPDAAIEEVDRVIRELKAVGVQMFTNVNGRPLDLPEYRLLFEKMAGYDLPIWLHPARGASFADYRTEKESKYEIWWTFGWPYETSAAMARIVFARYFDMFPGLKIVTHHMGGMIPFFGGRICPSYDQLTSRTVDQEYILSLKAMKKKTIEYFKMFLADTALMGSIEGTKCGLEFFGVEQVLFATDSPFDPEKGSGYIRDTIRVLDSLPLTQTDLQKIYQDNARRLLRLP